MAQEREIVIADPFAVLGVTHDAGDEAIKRRYLTLVRTFPRIASRNGSRPIDAPMRRSGMPANARDCGCFTVPMPPCRA